MSRVGKKYIPDLAGFPFTDQPMVGKILQRNLEMISSTLAQGSGSAPSSTQTSSWLPPGVPSTVWTGDYLHFTGTPLASAVAGDLWYDTAEQTLAFKNDIAGSVMNVGAEMWARGVNKTGSILADGKVVYVSGAQGNRPTLALSDKATEASVDNLIGLVTDNIGINSEGNVTVFGVVNGYDTSGFTAGDALYLSTAGGLTNTMPSAAGTDLIQHVGYALNSTNNGKVLVAPRGPSHLAHLHDVLDGTPTAGYILQGDGNRWTKFNLFGTANRWIAKQTFRGNNATYATPISMVNENAGASVSVQFDAYLGYGGADPSYAGYFNCFKVSGSPAEAAWRFGVLYVGGYTNVAEFGYTGGIKLNRSTTISDSLTVNNNTTLGDATSDTLTVNATSTFISEVAFNTNITAKGSSKFGDAHADTVEQVGAARYHYTSVDNSYIVEYLGDSTGQGILQRRIYGRTSASPYVIESYRNVGAGSVLYQTVSAANLTTYKFAVSIDGALTNGNLAGTGTRMVTASSTGLVGTRLANSYIIQTLTANAAIALDTELLRMTGPGFTGTLTASLGNSRVISFRNSGTGNLTVACNGAETIDGVATLVIPVGGRAKICSVGPGVWETVS